MADDGILGLKTARPAAPTRTATDNVKYRASHDA
jgi:hypothetical protein